MKKVEDRGQLALLFKELGFKRGVEVGVAGARYSECLLKTIPDLELFCVDPWQTYQGNHRGGLQSQHDDNYETAAMRLQPYSKAIMVKAMSADAVKQFENNSLDFVYIDGNHDFDFVMEDIIIWGRKVKKGGIISGHDYYQFKMSGVVEAVDLYAKIHNLELHVTDKRDYQEFSWYFEKK